MKSILLIEDNEDLRENTAEILELSNFKVHTAENGKEGVRMAKKLMPDLIVCDIMMPELDGFGVLFALSKDVDTANIPFIFLTAKSEKSDIRKGMNLGADDYLVKPFDEMELLDAIETRLKKSEKLHIQRQEQHKSLDSIAKEAHDLDDLRKLSEGVVYKNYKKKTIIFSEHTLPHVLYYIVHGKVKTFKINEEGKEYITGLYKGGDFFGFIELIQQVPYQSSAMTLEASEICSIPKKDFFSLIYNNQEIAHKFIKLLSNSILEKETLLLKMAYNSVRKRVAEALLLLHARYQQGADIQQFSMAISREDLANIAGTAKETLIRTLADFKDEQLISIQSAEITILNKAKLEAMKN